MELSIKNLNKSFGDKKVLQDISFSTESGKALGLLGRNGAGKTTIIRIIMDIFKGDSGEVLLDDKPISYSKVKFGYLPEERGLYPRKKVLEQLIYLGELKGMRKSDAKKNAEELMKKLSIEEYKNKLLGSLSKGNQQKVQLAAALISDPDVVILDEPFSGLDPVNAMILKDTVRELIDKNKIVLFSSHQMSYVEEFCENIAILNGGKIVLMGSIKDIKRTYERNKIIVTSKDATLIKRFIEEKLKHLVENIEVINEGLKLHLKEEKLKNDLVLSLFNEGFDIDGVSVYEPSLNDIFVEYTEGSIWSRF